MGYVYTIHTDIVTISAAQTLILVRPSATSGIEVIRATLMQSGGALTSENRRVQIGYKASAFPTTLTSVTVGGGTYPLIQKHKERDPVSTITGGTSGAAGTAGVIATSEGAGTFSPVVDESFNCLNGFLWVPSSMYEPVRLGASSGSAIVFRIPVAPTGTTNWKASLTIMED